MVREVLVHRVVEKVKADWVVAYQNWKVYCRTVKVVRRIRFGAFLLDYIPVRDLIFTRKFDYSKCIYSAIRIMSYGPSTNLLLERISDCEKVLYLSHLAIDSIPEIPNHIEEIYCTGTQITHLPRLPSGLQVLVCDLTPLVELQELPQSLRVLSCLDTPITALPDLPDSLDKLYCYKSYVTSLPNLPPKLRKLCCSDSPLLEIPELPQSLLELSCSNTHVTELPDLPDSIEKLFCSNTPLIIQREVNENLQDYNLRWRAWREQISRKRIQERAQQIHEELVAKVWHPRRVEKLLELGGWELIEAL